MTQVADLAGFQVPINSVKPHPENARTHALPVLEASLTDHDMYQPIIVQESTRHIVAGNGTWKAAKKLKWKTIAAVVVPFSDEDALAYLLADNRTGETGRYDESLLLHALDALGDLAGTGYSQDARDALAASIRVPNLDAEAGAGTRATPDAAEDYLNSEQRRLVLVLPSACAEAFHEALDAKLLEGETRAAAVNRLALEAVARADS